MNDREWSRSSFCESNGCVEVALGYLDNGRRVVFVRDLTENFGVATFTPGEWEAFVAGVKAGEFDL